MPFRTIPSLGVQYALISFDNDCRERTDDPAGGLFSNTLLVKAAAEKPTDIFLFSHGWKGDFPAAVDQYDRWIGAMWKNEKDREAMGVDLRPLFIGLHWPSQPWGEEKLPASASFAVGVLSPDYEALFESTVQQFGDKPEVRRTLRVIFDAQKADPGAVSLSDEVIDAYKQLGDAIGFSAGAGQGAAPDQEGEPLDPQEAVRANRIASAAVPFGSGGGGFFASILGGLRQLSFWIMKKRARSIGEGGMHSFVAALQNACSARIHLIGHSFGCIVMSSVVGGPGGNTNLPRLIESLAMLQGALSLWSYGEHVHNSPEPGYFHNVLKNSRVSGPIITSQSRYDFAVGRYYPAAVGLVGEAEFAAELPKYGAVGTFGIQGTTLAQAITMLDQGGTYGFKPGVVYNIESSEFIKKLEGASGAHNDIDGSQVAHALWQAALAGAKGEKA